MAQVLITSLRWRGVHYPGEPAPVRCGAVLERRPGRAVPDRRVHAHRAQANRGDHLVLVVGAIADVDQRRFAGDASHRTGHPVPQARQAVARE
jgi:hypothetical protein